MKSYLHCRETVNCLIIQVFTLMKHYSMGLEHGVQPNYHPSTHAVKSDYSLASQWVVPTSFLFSNHQMRMTAVLTPPTPTHTLQEYEDWNLLHIREEELQREMGFPYDCCRHLMWCILGQTGSRMDGISCKNEPLLKCSITCTLSWSLWNKPSPTKCGCLTDVEFYHLRTSWWESL